MLIFVGHFWRIDSKDQAQKLVTEMSDKTYL